MIFHLLKKWFLEAMDILMQVLLGFNINKKFIPSKIEIIVG